jgi:hypothetical protein
MSDSERMSKQERRESVARQMANTREQHPGQVTTPVEESPVQEHEATADAPESPAGVGESPHTAGEEIEDRDGTERGRHDTGVDPDTGRPAGTSDPSDATSVGEG